MVAFIASSAENRQKLRRWVRSPLIDNEGWYIPGLEVLKVPARSTRLTFLEPGDLRLNRD
jgi:hypothetical protein